MQRIVEPNYESIKENQDHLLEYMLEHDPDELITGGFLSPYIPDSELSWSDIKHPFIRSISLKQYSSRGFNVRYPTIYSYTLTCTCRSSLNPNEQINFIVSCAKYDPSFDKFEELFQKKMNDILKTRYLKKSEKPSIFQRLKDFFSNFKIG